MANCDEPSAAQRPENVSDSVDEQALERVLEVVPRGTIALAGPLVILLVVGWLLVYFLVFLPRGVVG